MMRKYLNNVSAVSFFILTLFVTVCQENVTEVPLSSGGDQNGDLADYYDDCLNSTAGNDVEGDDHSCTYIFGGRLVLNTNGGDGIDSNGSVEMTGSTVIIHGPSGSPEVSIDFNGYYNMDGGILIASGIIPICLKDPAPAPNKTH